MKFVRTMVVFDRGGLIDSEQWATMHESCVKALEAIVHPPGKDQFVIRRKMRKLNAAGKPTDQWVRNGVVPIKNQFLANLKSAGWHAERPTGLAREPQALEKAKQKAAVLLKEYPGKRDVCLDDADWSEVFHDKVGDFDFFTELSGGMRCVIEWETGNISSNPDASNLNWYPKKRLS